MTLRVGGHTLTGLRWAGHDLTQLRHGGHVLWSSVTLRDDFNRADADDVGSDWVHYGPTTYLAGVHSKSMRLSIPDGLLPTGLETDRLRLNTGTAAADDCYLEFRIGSKGSTGYKTQVFYRLSNGAFTHGVGIQIDSSIIRIVRLVTSVETVISANIGAYAAGDIIRMSPVGNIHTVQRNGSVIGSWNDSGATASKGAGFRSGGVRLDGERELFGDLLQPRKFSPTLDYVEFG